MKEKHSKVPWYSREIRGPSAPATETEPVPIPPVAPVIVLEDEPPWKIPSLMRKHRQLTMMMLLLKLLLRDHRLYPPRLLNNCPATPKITTTPSTVPIDLPPL